MIGVTNMVSWLGLSDVIFGGDKRQSEIGRVRYPNACCDHLLRTQKTAEKFI